MGLTRRLGLADAGAAARSASGVGTEGSFCATLDNVSAEESNPDSAIGVEAGFGFNFALTFGRAFGLALEGAGVAASVTGFEAEAADGAAVGAGGADGDTTFPLATALDAAALPATPLGATPLFATPLSAAPPGATAPDADGTDAGSPDAAGPDAGFPDTGFPPFVVPLPSGVVAFLGAGRRAGFPTRAFVSGFPDRAPASDFPVRTPASGFPVCAPALGFPACVPVLGFADALADSPVRFRFVTTPLPPPTPFARYSGAMTSTPPM